MRLHGCCCLLLLLPPCLLQVSRPWGDLEPNSCTLYTNCKAKQPLATAGNMLRCALLQQNNDLLFCVGVNTTSQIFSTDADAGVERCCV
jgi:hypothetical protein